jgi:23S rRNA (uridine2552-2'-O)-methyltransferase
LKFGDEFLKKWWNLLLKVFKWEDFSDLTKEIKKRFERFIEYKPLACRDRSFEEYVICINKKD